MILKPSTVIDRGGAAAGEGKAVLNGARFGAPFVAMMTRALVPWTGVRLLAVQVGLQNREVCTTAELLS